MEDLRVGDGVNILGHEQAQAREVVQLAAHGIAQDHAGRFGVERPVGDGPRRASAYNFATILLSL